MNEPMVARRSRHMPSVWSAIGLAVVLIALAIAAWQRADAPRAFFSGDEGVKSAQRAALADGHATLADPSRGFAIAAATQTDLIPWRPPFVVPCDGGVCSVWRNPVVHLGAALEQVGGPQLAALISWLGLVLWALAAALLATRLGAPAWPTALALLTTTPAWLYGIVVWEHAPAAAVVTLALAWALPSSASTAGALLRSAGLGVLVGLATLSRPESALLATVALATAQTWRRRRELAAFAGAALLPLLVEALVGGSLGAWLGNNAAQGPADAGWLGRAEQALSMLTGLRGADLPPWASVGLLAVTALAGLAVALRSTRAKGGRLQPMALLPIALLLGGVLLAGAMVAGDGGVQVVGLVIAAPAAVLGWLSRLDRDERLLAAATPQARAARRLALGAALALVTALLFAPNDGGSQWGPRYLLPWLAPGLAFALAAAKPWRELVRAALVLGLLVQLLGVRHVAEQQAEKVSALRWLRASPATTMVAHGWYTPQELAGLALDHGWDIALADSPALMQAATSDLAARRVDWWVLATAPGSDVRRAMDGRSPWRWVGSRRVRFPPVEVELHLLGTPAAIQQLGSPDN